MQLRMIPGGFGGGAGATGGLFTAWSHERVTPVLTGNDLNSMQIIRMNRLPVGFGGGGGAAGGAIPAEER